MTSNNFTDEELEQLNNYKNKQKDKQAHGGGGGTFNKDIYDKEFYEDIDMKSKFAYEALDNLSYENDEELEEDLLLYAKNAEKLDKAYGKKLIYKIKDDKKALNTLSKLINEGKINSNSEKYIKQLLDDVGIDSNYDIIEKLFNEVNDNTTDQSKFYLPDMGDFYLGNVDTKLLEKIDKTMRDKKDGMLAAHYSSLAPQDTLGYDPNKNMYFLRFNVNLNEEDLKNGLFDGNHLRLSLDNAESSVDDTSEALEKLESTINSINKKNNFDKFFQDNNNNNFNIDIVGIQCPKVPKWCTENAVDDQEVIFESFKKGSIDATKGFVFVQEDYDNMEVNDEMLFVRVMDTWRQAIIIDQKNMTKKADLNSNGHLEVKGIEEEKEYTYLEYTVIDGDTLKIRGKDGDIRVRLIGVNTPESVARDDYLEQSGKQNTDEGKIASDWLKEYLKEKTITVEFDTETNKYGVDKYDRPLVYVYVDGKMLNETIIEKGYSRHNEYSGTTKYSDKFNKAEQAAKANNEGFWSTLGDTDW